MTQAQRSFHPSGVSAQQVPEPTQTAPDTPGPCTLDTPSSAALQAGTQGEPPPKVSPLQDQGTTHPKAPPKHSAASEVPGSQGEKGFTSSSEPTAAPHATRPIPKVTLIMYSQAAIISTRDQLWPHHGKQKDTLRLTRAVSNYEVYRKLKTVPPQN